jgi:hypothetical protein
MQQFNRGEWSELYAALKILSEDYSIRKKNKVIFPACEPRNIDSSSNEYETVGDYIVKSTGEKISVLVIKNMLIQFHREIREGGKRGSFISESGNKLISMYNIHDLKAPNTIKADLIWNKSYLSVKSFLGQSPSIVNPSNTTTAVFTIVRGSVKNNERISLGKAKDLGLRFKFYRWSDEAEILRTNLDRICTRGSNHVASLLENYINQGKSTGYLSKLVESNARCLKHILFAFYVGMRPSKPWKDEITIDGILEILQNGEIEKYSYMDYVDSHWSMLFLDQDGHMKNRKGSFIPIGKSYPVTIPAATPTEIDGTQYFVFPLQVRQKAPRKR